MLFENGRLYYTRTVQSRLYYRDFSVDSGIVGSTEVTVANTGFDNVTGLFRSGTWLYSGRTNGDLVRVSWAGGVPTGASQVVSGPRTDGLNWAARAVFLGPGGPPPTANQLPTAAFTASCSALTCSFDGSASSDQEGPVQSYAWTFGDGGAASGAVTSHTFATPGTYQVALAVTDGGGLRDQESGSVTVTAIGLRGVTATASAGASTVSVTVPDGVQAGDGLVLVLSTNSTATGTAPAGFTQAAIQASGNAPTTQVFQRVAGADDVGASVTVTLSVAAKATLQLLAYSGTASGGPIASVTSAADGAGTSHTTPVASAPANAWAVSIWSDKSPDPRTWTAPPTVVVRSNLAGTKTGDVATLVADSGAPVSGAVGGYTATVSAASSRATMFTVVLAPAS
jgi:PKD repeat protein